MLSEKGFAKVVTARGGKSILKTLLTGVECVFRLTIHGKSLWETQTLNPIVINFLSSNHSPSSPALFALSSAPAFNLLLAILPLP